MEKQIKLFLEFLENDKRVSKNTLESYRRDIMQYADYIEENHMNYTKTSNEEIEEYKSFYKLNKTEILWDLIVNGGNYYC